jgi:hypothetical protein
MLSDNMLPDNMMLSADANMLSYNLKLLGDLHVIW